MARLPRIDLAGFHHVINRGVEKRLVFVDQDDYDKFLTLLCQLCTKYEVDVHSYCLMSNHYHLLIETHQENLSKFMRALNAQYAAYFNKKYKRVGHLWQGRFKSWFVTNEAYLYTLIKYIEYNPLKAKIVRDLGQYTYSSYNAFVHKAEPMYCLKNSIMYTQFLEVNDRVEFFESWYDEDILKEIKKASKLVVSSYKSQELSLSVLKDMFHDRENKRTRNEKIVEAVDLGYSQNQIATFLNVTQGTISHVLKKINN